VTARDLPVRTELAGVNMPLKPGGIRELHCSSNSAWVRSIITERTQAVEGQDTFERALDELCRS